MRLMSKRWLLLGTRSRSLLFISGIKGLWSVNKWTVDTPTKYWPNFSQVHTRLKYSFQTQHWSLSVSGCDALGTSFRIPSVPYTVATATEPLSACRDWHQMWRSSQVKGHRNLRQGLWWAGPSSSGTHFTFTGVRFKSIQHLISGAGWEAANKSTDGVRMIAAHRPCIQTVK